MVHLCEELNTYPTYPHCGLGNFSLIHHDFTISPKEQKTWDIRPYYHIVVAMFAYNLQEKNRNSESKPGSVEIPQYAPFTLFLHACGRLYISYVQTHLNFISAEQQTLHKFKTTKNANIHVGPYSKKM